MNPPGAKWTVRALSAIVVVLSILLWQSRCAYQERKIEAATIDLLARPMGDFDFDGIPLVDALQVISAKSGSPIVFNRYAALADGVPESAPVRIKLRGTTLGAALRQVLDSATAGVGRLNYLVQDGAVLVSTPSELARQAAVLRVYDVRKLIAKMGEGNVEMLVMATTQPMETAAVLIDNHALQAEDMLMGQVLREVSFASWRDRDAVYIEFCFSRLCVTQPPEVQAKVAAFLRKMEHEFGVK